MFYKRNFILFMIIMLCVVQLSCSNTGMRKPPSVSKGILDLRDRDLKKDGSIELAGEFEFYWERLLTPEDFSKSSKPEISGYIATPGAWNDHCIGKRVLGSYGYGTYRVKVKLNKKNIGPMGIRFSNEIGAFRIYVDNKMLINAGTPGTTEETTIPDYSVHYAKFIPEREEFDILVQVSNYYAFMGGMVCNLNIGTDEEISHKRIYGLALDLFIVGTFFIMGLYHLGLFILRRSNRAAFYFGILCFLGLGYSLVVGEKFFNYVFPQIPWDVNFKIVYFITYCLMITVLTFCYHLFKEDSSKIIVRFFQLVYIILIVIELITNSKVYTFVLLFYYAAIVFGFIYVIYIGVHALIKKRSGAVIYLAGFSFIMLATINDMLYTQKIIDTGDYLPLGLVSFFFSQSYMLAFRFTQSMKAEEKLTGELTELNSHLEQKVLERTAELMESQEKYRNVVERANDGIFIIKDTVVAYANTSAAKSSGYTIEEIVGKPFYTFIHPDEKERVMENYAKRLTNETVDTIYETSLMHKNGETIDVEFNIGHIPYENERAMLVIVRDNTIRKKLEKDQEKIITELQQAELQIRSALAEKEVLLKEIHHRVKNNLQIITSLLNLQASTLIDEAARGCFLETQNRVHLMALIHDKLYRSESLSSIDSRDYLNTVLSELYHAMGGASQGIDLEIDIEETTLPLDFAIPCGLIVNELMTNALKYAFPDGWAGKKIITFRFKHSNGYFNILFKDSGAGLPDNFNTGVRSSLGMELIFVLSTKQMKGTLDIVRSEGTEFHIAIPILEK